MHFIKLIYISIISNTIHIFKHILI